MFVTGLDRATADRHFRPRAAMVPAGLDVRSDDTDISGALKASVANGRFKIEAQPTYWKFGEEYDYELALCLSSQVTSALTVRLGYTYDHNRDDNRVMLQLYYYLPV